MFWIAYNNLGNIFKIIVEVDYLQDLRNKICYIQQLSTLASMSAHFLQLNVGKQIVSNSNVITDDRPSHDLRM